MLPSAPDVESVAAGTPVALTVSAEVAEGARITAFVRRSSQPSSVLSHLIGGPQQALAPSVAASAAIPYGRVRLTIALPGGLAAGSYEIALRFVAEANSQRTTLLRGPSVVVRNSP